MKGCVSAGGDLIDTDYGKPLRWIGLYITAASLLCAAAMGFDAIRAIRHRKLWFPCRLFSLNAATLAVLAICTKLPVDLNTAMPRFIDQLTKLSGTVLLCTAMGNLLPSLGEMGTSDSLSNVIALAILVVTIIVNICIQISTGVIYVFVYENAIVIFLLTLLLLVFVSSAIAIPAAKEILENDFFLKSEELDLNYREQNAADLRSSVNKYWLMAHSASPQYVLGRSVNSAASGLICILAVLILIEAFLRGLIWDSSLGLCKGTSDYAWSTIAVFVVQSVGVLVGTIAPAYRWFHSVNLRKSSWRAEFRVEDYWIKLLVDWKESPLKVEKLNVWTKIHHQSKRALTSLLIFLQKLVVKISKLFWLFSALPLSLLNQILSRKSDESSEERGLGDYVLHLKGEGVDLVRQITHSESRDVNRWINRGKKKKPSALTDFIAHHSTRGQGFTEVCSLLPDELRPHCWALPLVTLAAVAAALGSDDEEREVQSLLRAVGEGLRYVRLVEKHFDTKGLVNMRNAADMVWMDVLHNKWFDTKLRGERIPRNALEGLKQRAEERKAKEQREYRERSGQDLEDNPLEWKNWPEKMQAAVCMEKFCERILELREGNNRVLYERVRTAIADILGACLTNLPQAVCYECVCCKAEVREKTVRNVASVLGETEQILGLLEDAQVACSLPERKECIDDWRKDLPPSGQ